MNILFGEQMKDIILKSDSSAFKFILQNVSIFHLRDIEVYISLIFRQIFCFRFWIQTF